MNVDESGCFDTCAHLVDGVGGLVGGDEGLSHYVIPLGECAIGVKSCVVALEAKRTFGLLDVAPREEVPVRCLLVVSIRSGGEVEERGKRWKKGTAEAATNS